MFRRDAACTNICILSWNINGRLLLKLLAPAFCSIITQADVILLQETHLLTHQEELLQLEGYEIVGVSRKSTLPFTNPGGGVVTCIRSPIPFEHLSQWDSTDLLVVKVADTILINVYCPPANSPALSQFVSSPLHRISEVITVLQSDPSLRILIAGDFNARTSSVQPMKNSAPRMSPDIGPIDSYGRTMIRICESLQLTILNNTRYQ